MKSHSHPAARAAASYAALMAAHEVGDFWANAAKAGSKGSAELKTAGTNGMYLTDLLCTNSRAGAAA